MTHRDRAQGVSHHQLALGLNLIVFSLMDLLPAPTVCNSTIPLGVVFVLMTRHLLIYKHLHVREAVIHINQ